MKLSKNFLKKATYSFSLALFLSLQFTAVAFADDPKIVTGTVKAFQAVTGWLLLIIPVGAGAFLGFHALQKALTEDQSIIAEKNRLMKNVLIGSAIAETASGFVTLFLGFYN